MKHIVFISHSSKDAAIAQLICHRLEEAGIRCWIAPRDIQYENWALAIVDGFDRADVCVIVVGEHYFESSECPKELVEATHMCRYIVPFKVDETELPPDLRFHLGPYHWLDASTPPLEKRVEELVQRVHNLSDKDRLFINSRQMTLREEKALPRPLFLGREQELAEIAARLPEEKLLFLLGMGGIGKSEIAKAYAEKYQDRYDTVVFLGYEGSILDLVTSDRVMIENLPPQDTESESREDYFRRKMDTLRKITSERTLLILDNYDVDQDPHFRDLRTLPCHLLITTRNVHDDYSCMDIGPIADFGTVRKLFLTAYGKPLNEEQIANVDEMIRLVGCHTITVELLARQMKVSRRKPDVLLKLLKEGGINTHLKETISREGEEKGASSFEFISRLFTTAGLSPEQEQLLLYMTMVPYTGIDLDLFCRICELDSYNDTNVLIAHSWLMLDEDTEILSMHPVVADVVRERLHPTVESGRKYIAGLWREVGSLWNYNREERARLWPYYAYIIQHYFDPIPELWMPFSNLAPGAWICANYDLSIRTGHRFLEYAKKTFPDDPARIGYAATLLGGCYHNSGDDPGSAPYYEEGLECQKKAIRDDSGWDEWNNLSDAYQKIGRIAYLTGDFGKAKECFDESIRISRDKCDSMGCYGNALLETDRMYQAMGDYENALTYACDSHEFYVMRSGAENPNSACSLTDIGKCFMHLGRYGEAKEALDESLRLNIMFNGAYNLQTFWAKEALADLAAAQGRPDEALELCQEIRVEMEQCFGEHNPHLTAIQEKIASMSK
ncbi:MAG: tetratricopeptide repeat protein [Lachnospiraceae bacterium]|nr:tetratricopeptide repeat protein [Lachnospiraceae bacterium]